MDKPILVLQMQRMGDLILSFPLFLWLRSMYPERKVRVVAEKSFYEGLVSLSPEVLYIPWERYEHTLKEEYSLVVNLSHRSKAAWLAGKVKADNIIGPYIKGEGVLRISGDWQLYRSSIVHNNRYNRFHWAELNALDVVDQKLIKRTKWNPVKIDPGNKRIGVFIGASEEIKRPAPDFFALLCKELIRHKYQPIILGGPSEKKIASQVLSLCNVKPLNLTGKLSILQLAALFKNLGMLITPDTGPMHLAAWMGLPVINLSLGPVNPWETGPYQPMHTVMRSSVSCTGCWSCIQKMPLCVGTFKVRQVVRLIKKSLRQSAGDVSGFDQGGFKGVNVYTSGRNQGLYNLNPCTAKKSVSVSISSFWQSYWKYKFKAGSAQDVSRQAQMMGQAYPFVRDKFAASSVEFLQQLKKILQKGQVPDADFWKNSPPYFRPLVGYSHLMWQNSDYSPASLTASMDMVQDLLDFLAL